MEQITLSSEEWATHARLAHNTLRRIETHHMRLRNSNPAEPWGSHRRALCGLAQDTACREAQAHADQTERSEASGD